MPCSCSTGVSDIISIYTIYLEYALVLILIYFVVVMCPIYTNPCDTFNNISQGLHLVRRHRLISIGIPIINLRRSSQRLRFPVGISLPVERHLMSEEGAMLSELPWHNCTITSVPLKNNPGRYGLDTSVPTLWQTQHTCTIVYFLEHSLYIDVCGMHAYNMYEANLDIIGDWCFFDKTVPECWNYGLAFIHI